MTDRAALITALRSGRDRLDETLARFDDAAMGDRIDDEWTRKDVLAHIEAWERHLLDLVERLRAGADPGERVETDERNARFHAANRDRTLSDVRAKEAEAYRQMLAAIDGATDEELFKGDHFAWTDGEPLAGWFRSNGDEHYDDHLEQLARPAR